MTSKLNVGDNTLSNDFKAGDVAQATGLKPESTYTAELTDGDTVLAAKQFETLSDLPDPDPEAKPNKIPEGKLVIHPSATSIIIEDTDRSQSRKNQHMYVRMNSGKHAMVSLNKDDHLSDRSIEVTGTIADDEAGTLTPFTPETAYKAGTFIVGYIQDASESLEGDGLATDEFTTASK